MWTNILASIQESKQKLLNDIRNSPEMEYSDFNRSDDNVDISIESLKINRNNDCAKLRRNLPHGDYSDLNDSDEQMDSKTATRRTGLLENTKFEKFREFNAYKDYSDVNESEENLESNKFQKRKKKPDNPRKATAAKLPKRCSNVNSSDEENEKVSDKRRNLKSQEHIDVPTYEKDDYSNRDAWRRIAARKVVEGSSDEISPSSDNE